MNEYKPLKLDVAPMPTHCMAFATTKYKGKGKKASGRTKYIRNSDRKAMSPEAQIKAKVINACNKAAKDDDNKKSSASTKSAKMMKSIPKTMKSLENDNRRLKKTISALQQCKEDDDNDLFISFTEPAMLTFTNRQGCDISDNNPQDANSVGILDDDLIIIHPVSRYLWHIYVNQQGWPEGTASAVSECCIRNHGGSTIVLQEVCEKSHKKGVQDQSVRWVRGQ
jgi:hypothetical protein